MAQSYERDMPIKGITSEKFHLSGFFSQNPYNISQKNNVNFFLIVCVCRINEYD